MLAKMLNRLLRNWVYGTLCASLLLQAIAPLMVRGWPLVLTATYLVLPVYMLHQFEEHECNRFLRFINEFGKGRVRLTELDSFLINVPVVWGLCIVAIYLAVRANPGYAMLAFGLILVNGFVHTAQAIVTRAYNPGLGTALILFWPIGVWGLWLEKSAGSGFIFFGLGVAIALHLMLLTWGRIRALTIK